MRFNVEGKAFQQVLQAVSKVISAKNTIKILDNFLLRILDEETLSVTGGDSENVLTAFVRITETEGEGAIAVNARRLLEITKEIDNQPLQFEIDDETLEIDLRFMNGHFKFTGVDAKDYPERRELSDEARTLELPAQVVLKGIENTWFAVSNEVSRPVMTGIYWDIHDEDITFVSSDTHKLVRYINRQVKPEMTASFILPSKTSNIIRNLLGKDDAQVRIEFDAKGGMFEFGDFFLYSVFINGNYPNYNRVIPTENPFSLIVDRSSMINALRRVNLFAPKSSNLIVIHFDEVTGVKMSAQDLDYGTSAEESLVCEYIGNEMTVGFNGVFMVDILSNMNCKEVEFRLSDPARPGIFSDYDKSEDENLVTIQMPMQVI